MIFLNLGRLVGMKRHAQVVLIGRKSMLEAFSLKQRTYSVSVPKKNGKLRDVLKMNDIFRMSLKDRNNVANPCCNNEHVGCIC